MRFSPFIGMIFILLIEVALEYGITNIMKLYAFPFEGAIWSFITVLVTPKIFNVIVIQVNCFYTKL